MTIVTFLNLILIFRVRSSKPDHSAMLLSTARPSKSPLSAWCISESIIFKPRVTELLIFYLLTISDPIFVRSRQIQLQMSCLVVLRERPLGSHSSELRSHVSKPCSHIFEPRCFKLHPISFLHFFNPDPAPPDPRLRNICPVLATSIMRRISKRASRRIYKNNVSGMELGCRSIERRQSGPNNQDLAFWIRRASQWYFIMAVRNRKDLLIGQKYCWLLLWHWVTATNCRRLYQRITTCVWPRKPSDTSPTSTSNCYWCQIIVRWIYPPILLIDHVTGLPVSTN